MFSLVKLLIVLIVVIPGSVCFVAGIMTAFEDRKNKKNEIRIFTFPKVDKLVMADARIEVTVTTETVYEDDGFGDYREISSKERRSIPFVTFEFDGKKYHSYSDKMLRYVRTYCQDGKCEIRYTRWGKEGTIFENVDITVSYLGKGGKLYVLHHGDIECEL